MFNTGHENLPFPELLDTVSWTELWHRIIRRLLRVLGGGEDELYRPKT